MEKKHVAVVNNYKNWDKKLNLIIQEAERRERTERRLREETLNSLLAAFAACEPVKLDYR